MDDTVNLTFWVTGAVFVAVNLFMAYAIVRYRHRKGQQRRAEYEPEYKKLEWWLIGLTSVGVVAMLAPGLVVWAKFVTVPDDATVVEALGQQWSWSFRLPGEDGVLGAIDAVAHRPRQSVRHGPERSARPGRRARRQPGAAPAARQARQGAAALEGRAAQLHGAAVPRKDGHGAGHDHVPVAHADAARERTRSSARNCAAWGISPCAAGSSSTRPTPTSRGSPSQPTYAARSRPGRRPTSRRARPRSRSAAACHGANADGNQSLNAPEARRPARLVPRAAVAQFQARDSRRRAGRRRSPAR